MSGQGLTIKQASLELGLSDKTIRRHIKNGLLVADKSTGKYLISEDSLRHFDQTKVDTIPAMMTGFDPFKHVVIEREKWEGLLTRLGQLEEKTRLLEAPAKIGWWNRLWSR